MSGNIRWVGVALLIVGLVACGDTGSTGDDGSGMISCTSSSDCSESTVCSNSLCIPKCGPEAPCAAGEFCNGAGICVPNESNAVPCSSTEPCANGQLCSDGVCIDPCSADNPCPAGSSCNAEGACELTCTPSCAADGACGPDGCGGDCGSCEAGQLCAKNSCVAEADCTMTCEDEGAVCGTVCGNTCGTCADAEVCSTDLLCVTAPQDNNGCSDTCGSTGAVCGDVCGVSCGTCGADETCTNGSCVAGAEDCVANGCPAGLTCDESTGACGAAPTGDGNACVTCASDDDCSGGWSCIALSSGKVCLKPCNTNDVCDTGWSCVGNPAVCTPDVSYSCAGCVATGCPSGETCDPGSGECQAAKASCDACTENWQCGPGAACIDEASGGSVCKPRCSIGGDTCAESASCGLDSGSQLSVCSYQSESCCYDSEAVCGSGVTCEGATPHFLDGECVQCTTDDHCSGGVCNPSTHVCESEDCTGDTPFLFNGACVECLTNNDCDSGSCNTDSHTCVAANDECGQCNEDYPVCLELDGDTYCVQCKEDSDCDAGCTCDTQLYACSGNCVVSGAEQCTPGDNSTCPSHPDYTLICHESGLCVADNGACDGVTVQCPYGNPCVGLMDLLLGGGAGGLPGGLPLPGGGGGGGLGIPGACSCTPNGPEDPNSDDCPGSVQCAGVDLLGTGSETEVCSTLTCEDILGELLGPLAAIICAGL
ncbi:MAG: hypothetical protein ACPGU1_01125 [Myxococcota bacterium]